MHVMMFMPNWSMTTRVEKQEGITNLLKGMSGRSRETWHEKITATTKRNRERLKRDQTFKASAEDNWGRYLLWELSSPAHPSPPSPACLGTTHHLAPLGQLPSKRLHPHKACKADNCFSRLQP